ncbi:hypothetical protein E2562_039525 [Oryza meyeriana var. granulata]|uniref:Uncharacterized protein n=1 Tax=Oryza meyeriana var. granulata TaxID=110450 RepID=A0A6G1BQI4_9ORYZ|nr:hypothetical protein E2562_039525 [Oryza meyeriana var. granulata]
MEDFITWVDSSKIKRKVLELGTRGQRRHGPQGPLSPCQNTQAPRSQLTLAPHRLAPRDSLVFAALPTRHRMRKLAVPFSALVRQTAAAVACRPMRKLRFHEQKLLKKTNFLDYKRERGHRDAIVT